MNPISKEEFCKIINAFKRNEIFVDKLNDIFREFDKDIDIRSVGLEETLIDLLEIIFEDKENLWISYWVYEKNFGESYVEGDVAFDGKIVPLKTTEDLYAVLIDNIKQKNGYWIKHPKGYCSCSKCQTEGSPHWRRCPACESKMNVEEISDGNS